MTKAQLIENIKKKESFLCVGLDPDLYKIPKYLLQEKDPIFAFNKQIIEATLPYTVAYKPNTAFYEAMGSKGWVALEKTIESLPKSVLRIADAKRADIGNTSKMYARAFFNEMDFDAITVSPYIGRDSVEPFFDYPDKWVILLAATSNKGAGDFQDLQVGDQEKLYEKVIRKSREWGNPTNLMFVIGATRSEAMMKVRQLAPNNFLLVPGVGAQGGDLGDVCKHGMNDQVGLLVNASRSIIYAGKDDHFAEKAGLAAKNIQQEMGKLLKKTGISF